VLSIYVHNALHELEAAFPKVKMSVEDEGGAASGLGEVQYYLKFDNFVLLVARSRFYQLQHYLEWDPDNRRRLRPADCALIEAHFNLWAYGQALTP
jgi:hypothetical protein